MTVNAITDTKKGRTGIAPTYLHTTRIGVGGGEAIIRDRRLQVCHFACSSVYCSLYFINFFCLILCGRLRWILSAFGCTVNTQYRIVCSGRAGPVFRLNLV